MTDNLNELHWTWDSSQNFCFGYLCKGNADEPRWQHTWLQEPHADLTWVEGSEGPCPTKWAAIHGPIRPHLPAATAITSDIILLFLSLRQNLSWQLYWTASKRGEKQNKTKTKKREIQICLTMLFSLLRVMGYSSLDRTSFPTVMGLGASIHQILTFFQRQHSETKSAKEVSKCYKNEGGGCIKHW